MLGTRRVNGCALDIWCGPYEEFVVDKLILLRSEQGFNAFPFQEMLKAGSVKSHFGIAVSVDEGSGLGADYYSALVDEVVKLLESGDLNKWIRRVTLIVEKLADYKLLQSVFFARLPDYESD